MGLRSLRVVALVAAAVPALALLAGCALYESRTSATTTGLEVSDEALQAVSIGTTTRDQLVSLLGLPTQTQDLGGGKERLAYDLKTKETVSKGVLFLYSMRSETTRIVRHSFEVEDGVVVRHWREQTP